MNRSTLQVLGCYILWGLLPVFWKLLAGVNAAYVLAQRIVFSCLFCYAFIWIKKDGPAVRAILRDKKQRRLYLCCGLLISANWGVYILTVTTGRILEASLAYYMNPLFSILIGALIFRERLTAVQWVSSALAFIGVMYSVVLYGNVPYLAIIIALSFALYGALKKGIRARSEVSICMETLSVLPLALGFILYAQFSGLTTFSSLTGSEIVFLVLSGAVTSVPLMLFASGIQQTSITAAGILMYANPTLQLLLGVFVYGEAFTKANAVTFAFVWIAVILFVADTLRHRKHA